MQTQLGRYQTRLNRIVEIQSHRWIDEKQQDGSTIRKRIWSGMLLKADGQTPDSNYEWEDSGSFRNSRGVATYHDLAQLIEGRGGLEVQPNESEAHAELHALQSNFDALVGERDALRAQHNKALHILRRVRSQPKNAWNLKDEITEVLGEAAATDFKSAHGTTGEQPVATEAASRQQFVQN